MAFKDVAVQGATLKHGIGSPVTLGSFTVKSIPSTKMLVDGDGIFVKELTFSFTGGSHASCNPGTVQSGAVVGTPGDVTIDPTGAEVSEEGDLVMRDEDSKSVPMWCVPLGGGPPIPIGSNPVEIDNPGQGKVSAE